MRSAIFTALAILSLPLHASQEGALMFRNLHIESREESGPVVVDLVQGDKGVQRLSVSASGKSYQLTESQLKALGSGMYNFIQLSGEGGYEELGGRTIYIKIGMGFTSGEASSKYIVVNAAGVVTVKDNLRPSAP